MLTPQLRDVLDGWPVTAGDVRVVDVAPGFSGAAVTRVITAERDWCLRQWPAGPGSLRASRLQELHRWLAFLAQNGINTVAVPVRARTGATIVEASGRHWQLEPWLPGTADFHQRPTDARLRNIAVQLARLHQASAQYVATPAGTEWFACGAGVSPAVLERREKLERIAQRPAFAPGHSAAAERERMVELAAAVQRVAPRIAAELGTLMDVRVRLHPCLRDVWHDHILWTGDEVTGIIDPSAARAENVAADLSRLLGSLLGDARDRWNMALDTYASVRPLTSDERRLISVLDRSGVVLSAAHWLERLSHKKLTSRELERVRWLSKRVFALTTGEPPG